MGTEGSMVASSAAENPWRAGSSAGGETVAARRVRKAWASSALRPISASTSKREGGRSRTGSLRSRTFFQYVSGSFASATTSPTPTMAKPSAGRCFAGAAGAGAPGRARMAWYATGSGPASLTATRCTGVMGRAAAATTPPASSLAAMAGAGQAPQSMASAASTRAAIPPAHRRWPVTGTQDATAMGVPRAR